MAKKQENALRLLIIDDKVEDAEAIVSGLRNAGIAVRPVRAANAEELDAAVSGAALPGSPGAAMHFSPRASAAARSKPGCEASSSSTHSRGRSRSSSSVSTMFGTVLKTMRKLPSRPARRFVRRPR